MQEWAGGGDTLVGSHNNWSQGASSSRRGADFTSRRRRRRRRRVHDGICVSSCATSRAGARVAQVSTFILPDSKVDKRRTGGAR